MPNAKTVEDIENELVGDILEKLGDVPPEQLATFLENAARKLRTPQKCDHPQLYAHMIVDIAIPIEHNSAVEMTRALGRIEAVLANGGLQRHYKVHSPIEISESGNTEKEVANGKA